MKWEDLSDDDLHEELSGRGIPVASVKWLVENRDSPLAIQKIDDELR